MTSPLLDSLLQESQVLLQALGDTDPVPQPNTPEWLPFMRRLQQLDPVLAAKLAAAIRQSSAPPAKRGLDQRAKLRGARRNVVRRLLFREEPAPNGSARFVLDKRRAPVLGAVLVLSALGGYTLLWTLPSQQGRGLVEATMPKANDEKTRREAAMPEVPKRPDAATESETKGKAKPKESEETVPRRTPPPSSTASRSTTSATPVVASPPSTRAIDVPPPPVAFSTLSEAPARVVVPPRPAPTPQALVVEPPVTLEAPETPPTVESTTQTPGPTMTARTTAPRVVEAPILAASSPPIRVPTVSSARSNSAPVSTEVLVEAPFGGTADVELPNVVAPPAPVDTFGSSPAPSGETDAFGDGALVYARPAEAARPSGGAVAETSEASAFEGGSALVYTRPAEAVRPPGEENAEANEDAAEVVPASFSRSTSGLVYQKSGSETPSAPTNPFGGVPAPETPPASPFQPTQRVLATLVTGIEAVAGSSFPVVAHGGGGEWIGAASINATLSKVDIAFSKFVQGGQVFDVNALAYDPGLTQGLAASMRDVAPALASDLLRSGLSGLNSYAQSLAGGGTTLLQGGTALVQGNAVPLGTALLGELGKVFKVPENQPSFVRVAKIERGAPLVILIGVR